MKTVSAKVSDRLYEKIKEKAKERGLTVSELIKQALTKGKFEDRRAKKAIAYELNRIGINVNQIAKRCNINRAVDIATIEQLKIVEELLGRILKRCLR